MAISEESPIEGLAFFPNPDNSVFYPGSLLPTGLKAEPGVPLPRGFEIVNLADRFASKADGVKYYIDLALTDFPGAIKDLFQYGTHLVQYGVDVPYVVVNRTPVVR